MLKREQEPVAMQSALYELDDMGILRTTKIPPHLSWMTNEQVDVLLAVFQCGEDGMPRRRVRQMDETHSDAVRQLELRDYLQWERDRFGRLAYLCLTWKGDEAAQVLLKVAHNEQKKASRTAGS